MVPTPRLTAGTAFASSGSHPGRTGANWLVHRLAGETQIDALDAAANILADMGSASVDAILNQLESRCPVNQAAALLKALGWIGPSNSVAQTARLRPLLHAYISHASPEVREAAAIATRSLAEDVARTLLQSAYETEQNAHVRSLIEEEIEDRLPARA